MTSISLINPADYRDGKKYTPAYTEYVYDGDSRVPSLELVKPAGTGLPQKFGRSWDDNENTLDFGRITKTSSGYEFRHDGETMLFNDDGHIDYDSNNGDAIHCYYKSFWPNGEIKEITTVYDGPAVTYVSNFNEDGLLEKSVVTDHKTRTVETRVFTNHIDLHGNWFKKEMHIGDQTTEFFRDIEYWE